METPSQDLGFVGSQSMETPSHDLGFVGPMETMDTHKDVSISHFGRLFHLSLFLTASRMVLPKILVPTAHIPGAAEGLTRV